MRRCLLRVAHAGPHVWATTKSTWVLPGECQARPNRREAARKAAATRKRRAAEAAARPRIALVQRSDDLRYYKGGWGFTVFWTAAAGEAAQLTFELAERAVRNLATRGILATAIPL